MKKFLAALAVVVMLAFAAHPSRMVAQESAPTQAAAAPANQADASADDARKDSKAEEEEADENDPYLKSDNVKMFSNWFHWGPEKGSPVFWALNCIILFALLGWGLLKALPKLFRSRTESIQKQIVDAKAATEQANARLAEVEKKLARLDEEIAAISKNAEAEIANEEKRMKDALETEKQRIVTASEQEIESAAALAERRIRRMAAELAIDQATKDINISKAAGKQMVEEFAGSIGKKTAGGKN